MRLSLSIALLLLTARCPVGCSRGHPEAYTLAPPVEIPVELDQLKPMLFALQGKSFQPARVDDVLQHIGIAAGRLGAGVDDPYSAGVAVNLAGLSYDILRLDAEARARGFGGQCTPPPAPPPGSSGAGRRRRGRTS